MSALCSIQLLNGGYEKHIEVEREGNKGVERLGTFEKDDLD